jgi:hypothetical protein
VLTILSFGVPLDILIRKGGPNNFDERALIGTFGILGVLCGYSIFWFSRIRVAVFEEGIAKNYVYGTVRFIPWGDIISIKSRYFLGMIFIVTEQSSRWISVNHNMDGIDVMFREIRARLDPKVYGNELEKPFNNHMHLG